MMGGMRRVLAVFVIAGGCGGNGGGGGPDGAPPGPDATAPPDVAPLVDAEPTWGSMCGANPAVLTGQIFAPNGTDPVPAAYAYVPMRVDPILPGVACELCDTSQDPAWTSVQTGVDGRFSLDLSQVPLSVSVELAVRKGRFRKVTPISVTCGSTAIAAGQTTLPGNVADGDMPRIAVGSGNVDHLDALLVELGITSYDCFEGRTSATNNCPAAQATGQRVKQLLSDAAALSAYNLLFLSCAPNIWDSYTAGEQSTIAANLASWVNAGGRVFVTDHSYDYVSQAWPDAIIWHGPMRVPPASWEIGTLGGAGANVGLVPQTGTTYPATVDDTTIVQWLQLPEIGVTSAPSVDVTGWLAPWSVQKALGAGTAQIVHGTVDWDYAGSGRTSEDLPLTSQFTVNDCGRVVYSSYHTTTAGGGAAQERILEYLMLDVASCIVVE